MVTTVATPHVAEKGRTMEKGLSKIGNSLGIIIERPVLDLIGADEGTRFNVITDGVNIVLQPVGVDQARVEHVRQLTRRIFKRHEKAFRALAQGPTAEENGG